MALSSVIQFGDNNITRYSREYPLLNVELHFKREDDGFRPTTDAVCESVVLSLVAPPEKDRFFNKWFIDGEEQSGCILTEISDPTKDNEPVVKEIYFQDAMLFSFEENFELDIRRRSFKLGMTAATFKIQDISF
ncbi:MAG: hypothetical protein J1E82_04590 [Muribaculaceae bacterium]|nr:hypothetical protein [Muribaculaceae bacterium]